MNLSERLPSQAVIIEAMLNALKENKEGMHIIEIETEVAKLLSLTKSQMEIVHKGKRTLLGYKLAWARTSAKKQGLIESPKNSVWRVIN